MSRGTLVLMLASAAGLALAFGGAVVLLRQRSAPPASSSAAPPALDTAPLARADAPDIRQLATVLDPAGGSSAATITRGEGLSLRFLDRDDPTRVTGALEAATSIATGPGTYDVTTPRARLLLRDGGVVVIDAAQGTLRMPEGAALDASGGGAGPDQGELRGSVRARFYRVPPLDPASPADAELTTSRMLLDWTLGQVDIPEDFTITTPTLRYEGQDLHAQFDPVSRTLHAVHVARTRELLLTQSTSDPAQPGTQTINSPSQPAPTTLAIPTTPTTPDARARVEASSAADTAPTSMPQTSRVDNYAARIEGDVQIQRQGAVLRAPLVEGWARLVDGALPHHATGPRPTDTTTAQRAPTDPAPPAPAQGPSAGPSVAATPQPTAPVITRITFTGPFSARRLASPPEALATDAWALDLRTTADADAKDITLQDPSRGVSIAAKRLRYFATREVLLAGIPDNDGGLSLALAGMGTLRARGEAEFDLREGVVRVLAPGSLASDAPPPDDRAPVAGRDASIAPASLSWSRQARFKFALPDDTGPDLATSPQQRLTRAALERVHALGTVVLRTDDGATLEGQELTADFASPSGSPDASPSGSARIGPLRALAVLGEASFRDASGRTLACDLLQLDADPDAQPRAGAGATAGAGPSLLLPATLVARGNAQALTPITPLDPLSHAEGHAIAAPHALPHDRITADEFTLRLVPAHATASDPNPGGIVTESLHATSASPSRPVALARVTSPDAPSPALSATAHELKAWPDAQRVELSGQVQMASRAAPPPGAAAPTGTDASLEAPRVQILAREGRVLVPEGGSLALRQHASPTRIADNAGTPVGPDPASVTITWTGEGTLDESLGIATFREQARADARTTSLARGSTERVELAADALEVSIANLRFSDPQSSQERGGDEPARVRSIRALARDPAQPASSHPTATLRSVAGPAQPEQLAFLQAPDLLADLDRQHLSATGPGQFLLRGPASDASLDPSGSLAAGPGGTGQALFRWQGSMLVENGGDRITLERDVRMLHRALPGGRANQLECGRMIATLTPPDEAGQRALDVACATGGVRALLHDSPSSATGSAAEPRELTAALLRYDARNNLIEAAGDATTSVLVAQGNAQPPLSAGAIRWNLATGRIEVIDPGAIATGR